MNHGAHNTSSLAALLQWQATEKPDRPALIAGQGSRRRSLTFAELDDAAARAATLLSESGLVPGDHVLVLQPVSLDLYVALVALLRSGMVAMFLDPTAGRDHIEHCCRLQPPKGLIAAARAHALRFVSRELRRVPVKFSIGATLPGARCWARWRNTPPKDQIFVAAAETPALLTFTSGTTGQAKAALRTHGFLLAQHRVLARALQLDRGQIDLCSLPIFVLANLASGVTSVLPDADLRNLGTIDSACVLTQMMAEHPTRVTGSPTFLARLAADFSGRHAAWSGVAKIFTGGGPVFLSLLRRLAELAPGTEINAVYGSTEAEPIAHIKWAEMTVADQRKTMDGGGLLCGTPVTEIALRIIPDRWGARIGPFSPEEFERQSQPAGESGEIVVSGEHVLPGYLFAEGDHNTKFRAGRETWHRTGDAGYLDNHGRLWLVGRCSAQIRDQSGSIYPLTVEAAAMEHPHVRRAAFISVQGERILAVEADEALAANKLRAALSWAVVESVRRLDHIPVDTRHHAKIDYAALRAVLECAR